MGHREQLEMSEVKGGPADEVPGLVGPQQFKQWQLALDFVSNEIGGPQGTRPMNQERSGHPQLDLTEYPSGMNIRTFISAHYVDGGTDGEAENAAASSTGEPGQNGAEESDGSCPALV